MNQKSTSNKITITIYRGEFWKTIKNNVKSKDETKKIKLNIYYKNLKTSNLILKNNPSLPTESLDNNNMIYKFNYNNNINLY